MKQPAYHSSRLWVIVPSLSVLVSLVFALAHFNHALAEGGSIEEGIPATNALTGPAPVAVYLPFMFNAYPQYWVTVLSDGFEGVFPGSWRLETFQKFYDGYWYDVTEDYAWGKKNCHAATGSFGAWMDGGGGVGSVEPCGSGYLDDFESWMVYGPFDLSQIHDARFSLKIWTDTEFEYDVLGWGVSIDNNWFYGSGYTGYSNGWLTKTLDLRSVYTLGDVTGLPQVWIGVWFESDSLSDGFYEGAGIDDMVFSTCASADGCLGSPGLSAVMQDSLDTAQEIPTARQKPGAAPNGSQPKILP